MEEKTKYVRGPWTVSVPTSSNPSRASVTAFDGFVLIYDAPLTEETKATADLIAAAPDLLEACKAELFSCGVCFQVVRGLQAGMAPPEDCNKTRHSIMRDAYAKAKGDAQ